MSGKETTMLPKMLRDGDYVYIMRSRDGAFFVECWSRKNDRIWVKQFATLSEAETFWKTSGFNI
jgi:hypothetical protein